MAALTHLPLSSLHAIKAPLAPSLLCQRRGSLCRAWARPVETGPGQERHPGTVPPVLRSHLWLRGGGEAVAAVSLAEGIPTQERRARAAQRPDSWLPHYTRFASLLFLGEKHVAEFRHTRTSFGWDKKVQVRTGRVRQGSSFLPPPSCPKLLALAQTWAASPTILRMGCLTQ